MSKSTGKPVVIIPNLNGGADLLAAVESLIKQSLQPLIIVVDNASTDGSADAVEAKYPEVELIRHTQNKGYAGGVNPGFKRAIDLQAEFAAPFNDDALADPKWLETLVETIQKHPRAGVIAPKVSTIDGSHLDSTGDLYTVWGLAYPRGRGELDKGQYDNAEQVFAASGAASLYRVKALQEVGLLDEAFFAYYEDVDLSFRLCLAGWEVWYEPTAKVYHQIGATSSKIKGFTTYQTMKNLPLLAFKNVPRPYLWRVFIRLHLALLLFFARAVSRGQAWPAIKGSWASVYYLITKIPERRRIQKTKKITDQEVWDLMTHDLPVNARALRTLRDKWWKLTGRK